MSHIIILQPHIVKYPFGTQVCGPQTCVLRKIRYERYDFSDEMKFDEEMWEIVKGEYDEFENSDSFSLIESKEFQDKWDNTELNYKPKPY